MKPLLTKSCIDFHPKNSISLYFLFIFCSCVLVWFHVPSVGWIWTDLGDHLSPPGRFIQAGAASHGVSPIGLPAVPWHLRLVLEGVGGIG